MKQILFILIMTSSIYASGYYKRMLYDCDQMYSAYKNDYRLVAYFAERSGMVGFDPCTKLGKVNRSSSLIEEAQDEVDFLEFQRKTLGVACEQIKMGIKISFKSEYCNNGLSTNSQPTITQANNEPKKYEESVPVKQIDPAIKYKKSPQLKLSKLHIYDIRNITYFREQKEIILIESSLGNYAIPKNELTNAERINFTPELSQRLDALLY